MTPIPTYRADNGDIVQFLPVANVPGFSHRVIINSRPVAWLGSHRRPSVETAQFFWEQHRDQVAA